MGTSTFDFLHSSFWGFLECQTTVFFSLFLKRTGGFKDGDGESFRNKPGGRQLVLEHPGAPLASEGGG